MTSVFEALAVDDSMQRTASRKAVAAAKQRVDDHFGAWFRQASNNADLAARINYAYEEVEALVKAAAEEYGSEDDLVDVVVSSYAIDDADVVIGLPNGGKTARTAAFHEAVRKPRMCPFHKDVVDISLASGDPRAGFDSMAQHWGGSRHCEGEGYEGESCKFKPQMTTQSYWDEKAEKAEERKQQRQQAEQDVQELVDEQIDESPVEEFTEPEAVAPEIESEIDEGDFATEETAPEGEIPLAMAAKTATETTGLGGPEPKIDKRKWTPQTVKKIDTEGDDSPNPTKRKDVVEPIRPDNSGALNEIGENTTERQDVEKDSDYAGSSAREEQGGSWTEGPKKAVSSEAPDVYENGIVELINNDFDGFPSQLEIEQALLAHHNR